MGATIRGSGFSISTSRYHGCTWITLKPQGPGKVLRYVIAGTPSRLTDWKGLANQVTLATSKR